MINIFTLTKQIWPKIDISWIQLEEREISGIHYTILYTFIFEKFYDVRVFLIKWKCYYHTFPSVRIII